MRCHTQSTVPWRSLTYQLVADSKADLDETEGRKFANGSLQYQRRLNQNGGVEALSLFESAHTSCPKTWRCRSTRLQSIQNWWIIVGQVSESMIP
jgi:hypothetical protein